MNEHNRRKTDQEEADWEIQFINIEIQNRLYFACKNDNIKLRPNTDSLPYDIEKKICWGDVMRLTCEHGVFEKVAENEYIKLVDGFSTDEKGRLVRDLNYFVEKQNP